MKNLFTTVFVCLLFLSATPGLVCANEIRLEAQKVELHTGEQFLVDVVVGTDVPLNAVEGKVSYPKKNLKLIDLRDGNSVISFWIERPHDLDGVVSYSGATPVGFSGTGSKVYTLLFEAIEEGAATIAPSNSAVYINDGTGNKAEISEREVHVIVLPGGVDREIELSDVEPPEDFLPVLVQDANLNEGKQALLFAAQDKGVGIDRYEVREGRFGFFRRAESPYVLRDPLVQRTVYIKAIDKNGNVRVVQLAALHPIPFFKQVEVICTAIAICLLLLLPPLLWKKFRK